MQFCLVSVVSTYLNFVKFSRNSIATFML
jgi:hypothetical protein